MVVKEFFPGYEKPAAVIAAGATLLGLHPSLMDCCGSFQVEATSGILMRKMDGNLTTLITSNFFGDVTLHNRVEVGMKIAEGIRFLHLMGASHMDLKPPNILVSLSSSFLFFFLLFFFFSSFFFSSFLLFFFSSSSFLAHFHLNPKIITIFVCFVFLFFFVLFCFVFFAYHLVHTL